MNRNQIMTLVKLLSQKREGILKKWLASIAKSQVIGSNLLDTKDPFTNPIGHIFSSESVVILDQLIEGHGNSEAMTDALYNITRVTAVQDISPSQAVAFVFLLKGAIMDQLGQEMTDKQTIQDWLKFEATIDDLALLTFDAYTRCREKLIDIRMNEIKVDRANAFRMLERISLKHEELEDMISGGYNMSEVSE